LMWSRRSLSLGALRRIELFMVVGTFGATAWDIHRHLPESMARADSQPIEWLLQRQYWKASEWSLWVAAYGVFIPNTWRRCLAVVSMLVLMPLLAVGLALLSPHATPAVSARLLWGNFPYMVGILAIGAAVAIYGTHKITTLREVQHAARQLGQYRLKRRLGAGGMGEVYLAEHRLLKRPCAVKLVRPERAGDTSILQRFEREVQAMTRLTHWNVVEVFDYGRTDDGTFYYVMEYLPGLTLGELVKEKKRGQVRFWEKKRGQVRF